MRFVACSRHIDSAAINATSRRRAAAPTGHWPHWSRTEGWPAASWVCLTGTAQIAHCWMLLYRETGDARYRDGAYRANQFVRRTMRVSGDPGTVGGVKGSFPV